MQQKMTDFHESLFELALQEMSTLRSSESSADSTPKGFVKCQELMMSEVFDPNSMIDSEKLIHPYCELPLIHCVALLISKVESKINQLSMLRDLFTAIILRDSLDMNMIHKQTGCQLLHFIILHCTVLFHSSEQATEYFRFICKCLKAKDARLSSLDQSDSSLMALEQWCLKDVVDGDDATGFSPLWRAVQSSQCDIARSLVGEFGLLSKSVSAGIIDANRKNGPSQQTLAHLTFSTWPTSDPEAYRLIDEFSCKLGVLDIDGEMPLMLAQKEYRTECGDSSADQTTEPGGCGFEMFMALSPSAFESGSKSTKTEQPKIGSIYVSSVNQMTHRGKMRLAALCPIYGAESFKESDFTMKDESKCPYSMLHSSMITLSDAETSSEDDWKSKIPEKYRMFADQLTPVQMERVMKGQCPFSELAQSKPVLTKVGSGCPMKQSDNKDDNDESPGCLIS